MPLFVETILIILSAVLSLSVALLIRKINKRDERAEERQQELIACRVIEMKFARGTGSLAHHAAVAVKKADKFPIGNGDLQKAIDYYKDCEHCLEDYYQKLSAANNVRGG